MEGEGKFVREGSLYPYKIPSNFHGCTVNLSAHRKGGIEDEFYSQYFLTHNITRNYVNGFHEAPPGSKIIATYVLNSDMAFGFLPLVVEEIIYAKPTFPYFPEKLNWFVPCPKPLSRLQRISHIFSPSVWVATAVVLFLVTVVSCCLAKQSNDIRSYSTLSSALYNIWSVTVGVSVTGMPRNLRLRFLFVVFVLYCSAISTVLQMFLTSFLVDPGYENQLRSLDEILDSGIEFGYSEISNIIFNFSSDLRHKEVVERAKIFSKIEECIDRIRERGNFATFAHMWIVQNYTNIISDHSNVCVLNDDDYNFNFITTYVQKGSLFLESLNKYITVLIESGIIDRFFRNSIYVPKPTRDTTDLSDGYFVFTLSRLRIAFYIFLFGHGLSFLLFLCEVFCHFRLRYV
jgi:hypothetical protein